jgi:16S rRNA (uracil1498-N3)-methyltransferase
MTPTKGCCRASAARSSPERDLAVSRAPSELVVGGFAAHVFVEQLDELDDDRVTLRDDDAHHLFRVRRLRDGEFVSAGDGAGRWRACVVQSGGLAARGPVVSEPRLSPPLTVGFALVKGERPETIVQKLTEAGVDLIIPLLTERSVVRWSDAEAAKHATRLDRVATEAAMQCRRAWLPFVSPALSFRAAVQQLSAGELSETHAPTGVRGSVTPDGPVGPVGPTSAVALADVEGGPPSLAHPAVLVGPEGGWSADELSFSLPRVALGEQVYRAETAAVAAGVVLTALRAGLVAERGKTTYPESRRRFGG